jgi:hypothetical protein
MRVLPATAIEGSMLTYSTISELDGTYDPDAWNAATAYVIGDEVARTTTHRVYTRLTDGTSADAPEDDATNWVESGATNKYAMFDLTRNQTSKGASPMVVQFAPGARSNAIALNGVVADSIRVKVYRGAVSPGQEIYDSGEINMVRRTGVIGWYSWFMRMFRNVPQHALFDLPPFTDAVIEVTFTRSSGVCECAAIGPGMAEYIGSLEEGPGDDAISYSTVTRQLAGETEAVKRRAVPAQSLVVFNSDINTLDTVRELREDLDAEIAFYIGVEDEDHPYYRTFFRQALWNRFRIQEFSNHFVINLEIQDI